MSQQQSLPTSPNKLNSVDTPELQAFLGRGNPIQFLLLGSFTGFLNRRNLVMSKFEQKTSILLLILGSFSISTTTLQASEIVVAPAISEVKVYISGSEVIRKFTVEVPEGQSRILVQGLPPSVSNFEAYTLHTDRSIRVVDTSRETRYTTRPFADSVVEIEEKIDALNQEVNKFEDGLKTVELELEFLQQLVDHYPTHNIHESSDVSGSVDIANKVLDLVGDRSKNALDVQREIRLDLNNAQRELDSLEKERDAIGGKQLRSTELSMGIVASESGESEFVVSYFARQSSWRPTYHAYLDSATKKVTVLQDAVVTQRSPEPWTNVKLTLTTANPRQDADPPELFSHFVDKLELKAEAQGEAVLAIGSRSAVLGEFDFDEVGEVSFDYTTEFTLDVPQSVQNNNSEHGIIGLGTYEIEGVEVTTTVIPRHDDLGYLSARFTFNGEIPLPRGNARCFVDGSYVGRVNLPIVNPKEEVTLPLGRDHRIEVALESQGGTKGREGFLRNRKVEETHFVVNIQNHRSTPSNIEVLDYYPVSRHEDVNVEVHRDATQPDKTDVDDRPGRLAWVKTLGPNEKWTIVQRYSVSYPRDSNISTSYVRR